MSTAIVIFGATGDLTARKLIPALYNNFRKKRLPEYIFIIACARRPYSSESFRDKIRNQLPSLHLTIILKIIGVSSPLVFPTCKETLKVPNYTTHYLQGSMLSALLPEIVYII